MTITKKQQQLLTPLIGVTPVEIDFYKNTKGDRFVGLETGTARTIVIAENDPLYSQIKQAVSQSS